MLMKSFTKISVGFRAGIVLVASLGMTCGLPVLAKAEAWTVEGKIEGGARKGDPKAYLTAQDVSGIACATETGFPRQCIVIDDEAQRAQVVIVHDKKIVAGESIKLISNSYKGDPLELDGEGVAYDEGYFYVMGSHGGSRGDQTDKQKREAEITATSQLIRFRLDASDITTDGKLKTNPKIEVTNKLRAVLGNYPDLRAGVDVSKGGLTIEGVAVKNGKLYAGLRAPSLSGGRAVVISLPVDLLFDDKTATPPADLHYLTVGDGYGVRDLVSYQGGFIVLIGPAPDLEKTDPGKYWIYRWDGVGDVSLPPFALEVYRGRTGIDKSPFLKPEAILPLEQGKDGLRILVIHDGAERGRPHEFTLP